MSGKMRSLKARSRGRRKQSLREAFERARAEQARELVALPAQCPACSMDLADDKRAAVRIMEMSK